MRKSLIYLLYSLLFVSCSHIREAQKTVESADSLFVYGILYKDSMNIARAAKTFQSYQVCYSDEYARTNYYYGRLLREKGKQAEAMQCFLKVLHSHSDDHNFRGRTYTNMAVMCRQEGNHPLAYTMFELSSKEFYEEKDTTAYFYALNSMAFELAELARKDECLSLLSEIEQNCKNKQVLLKILETKAEVYFMAQQYDSAIYYADLLHKQGNSEPTGILIKAQSFSYLGQHDSAVVYARKVVDNTVSLFDLNNSLYILANEDENAKIEEIQKRHTERSDIQKQIELRHAELSRAIEIMQQDMNKKSDYRGIILLVMAIGTVIIVFVAYYLVKRKRKMLILEQNRLQNQKQQIRKANEELIQQQEQIMQINAEYSQQRINEIEHLCEAIRNSEDMAKDIYWSDEKQMCKLINEKFNFFANKLAANNLTRAEFRLCILVLIDLRFDVMSEMIPYALNSIGKLKDTTAKKLGTTGKNLRKYLLNMVIGQY